MPVKYKSAKRKMSKPAKKKVNMAHGKKKTKMKCLRCKILIGEKSFQQLKIY